MLELGSFKMKARGAAACGLSKDAVEAGFEHVGAHAPVPVQLEHGLEIRAQCEEPCIDERLRVTDGIGKALERVFDEGGSVFHLMMIGKARSICEYVHWRLR